VSRELLETGTFSVFVFVRWSEEAIGKALARPRNGDSDQLRHGSEASGVDCWGPGNPKRKSRFNPRNVWWMVRLIAGIGFAGYLAHKFMPQRSGMLVSGFVGVLVSSTATKVSYARRVADDGFSLKWAATIVTMASAVVFVRLTLEIAVASRTLFTHAAPPLLALFLLLVAAAIVQWRQGSPPVASTPLNNPSQLGVAFLFALIYVLVLFAAAAARDGLGNSGLYLVAIVSGLTEVDAITLFTARMVDTGNLDGATGWRVVVIATLSNLAAKAAMAASIGGRVLLRQIALLFGAAATGGLLAIWLYY